MKKILILFTNLFSLGGFQQYNRFLCNALGSEFSNCEFIILSLYDVKKNQSVNWDNIRVYFFGNAKLKTVNKIRYIFEVIKKVTLEKLTFLICGHIDLSPLALFFKKIFAIEYAVLTQGVDVWNIKKGLKFSGLKNASLVLTVSKYTKDKMIANGIDEKKIVLLPHAVDTTLFYKKSPDHSLIQKLGLAQKKVLLTVGRISSKERYKGHHIMLKVLRRTNDEYVWLVIGEGDDLPLIKRKAKDLGVIKKTRFLGRIDNEKLVDYYNLSDVFVMPSKGEGFGRVFLEALACGKPVIGGNRDGTAEPLMNGKLGFLVNPDNAAEIRETIDITYEHNENRTNPEYLIEETKKNFNIKAFNKKTKSIFEKLL